jgi:hypothetical protein
MMFLRVASGSGERAADAPGCTAGSAPGPALAGNVPAGVVLAAKEDDESVTRLMWLTLQTAPVGLDVNLT